MEKSGVLHDHTPPDNSSNGFNHRGALGQMQEPISLAKVLNPESRFAHNEDDSDMETRKPHQRTST